MAKPSSVFKVGSKSRGADSVVAIREAPSLIWNGVDYPRVSPGLYVVRGIKIQGPVWLRKYRRWSLRVEFALVHESKCASKFFNMGNDPKGPRIGRHSEYWKWWTAANGEMPRRGQEMSPEVFLEGQFFTVSIEDSLTDSEGQKKAGAEVYSRITKLHSVEWPQS